MTNNNDDDKLWLRIIAVNDVYELDNFPSLKTLIDEHQEGPDKVLVILAGDFLGPSLLSSLDRGRGMVDTMNNCGITHVSFGNHEADIPAQDLAQRIALDSKFVWLNTNMRELDDKLDVVTEPHQVIEVSHGDDDKYSKKTIGLMGLLTEDPSVYRPGVFGGATIEPVLETAEKYLNEVLDPLNLDLVIPLTHQRMNLDRDFCAKFKGDRFPIVIGAHDHEPYDATIEGSRVIKTGMDGINTAIIDITWKIHAEKEESSSAPHIEATMIPTNNYPPDPELLKVVQCHKKILNELEAAKIFRIDHWLKESGEPFSTQNNRLGPSNGSKTICSMLRMGTRSQCCILNSGGIRAGKVYPKEHEWFSWSDLKAEIPFPTELGTVKLPGSVLEEMIRYSRRLARQDPPVSSGAYVQHCDRIEFDDESGKIVTIEGKSFEPDHLYLTTLPISFFQGIDNHVPLLQWAKEHNIEMEEDCGKPAKIVIVEMFAAMLWLDMGSFDTIDTNNDGVLTKEEVRDRAAQVFGTAVADLVVDSVFSVADLEQKGFITPVDMAVVEFVASDMFDHIATDDELAAMQHVASKVLGGNSRPSCIEMRNLVKELKDVLDIDSSGTIDRREAIQAVGRVSERKRNLLT